MRNFWLVARHEFRRIVVRRAFILLTLAIPLGMAALIGMAIVVAVAGEDRRPVGYVDQAGFLDQSLLSGPDYDQDDRLELRAYESEGAAQAALERDEVQAVFIIPDDYLTTLETRLVYLEESPSGDAWRDFGYFLRLNVVQVLPEEIQTRVLGGSEITVYDPVNDREFSEEAAINIALPFIATFVFFIATMSASCYMLQVVADEKENRTMEIVLTSLSPGQLIGGKMSGLLAAALTQLGIYALVAVVGVLVARPYLSALQDLLVPWRYLGIMTAFFFPSYILIAAVMVAIGSAVTELQQGQQVAGILNLFFMMPLILIGVLFSNPSHPLLIFFTFFPTTAFLTISLRWGLGSVPFWQIGISWLLLVATAAFAIWAAARIFRVGMLRYGQPMTVKGALAAVGMKRS